MRKYIVWGLWLALAGLARADERKFDFSKTPTNEPPIGAHSVVAGEGKPGDWRVILDDVPTDSGMFTTNATLTAKKSVVAQLARNTTDEHYPVLVLSDDIYGDFTFTAKFKMVDGETEQMAGLVFRLQDAKNFYVVRASALGGTFYFARFEKGLRTPPTGNFIKFEKGVWHEMSVDCFGTTIRVKLDGKQALPDIDDPTFAAGKVGFWTKSDSVSYFADARITYTPREPFAQRLVRDILKEYPRLVGLKMYAPVPPGTETRLIASNDEKEIGRAGAKSDADCIKTGINYYLRENDKVTVTLPLCDRNGDPVAAVRVELKPMRGQTQENALIRALPIIKTMQERMALATKVTD
jgi:hypothetical protein